MFVGRYVEMYVSALARWLAAGLAGLAVVTACQQAGIPAADDVAKSTAPVGSSPTTAVPAVGRPSPATAAPTRSAFVPPVQLPAVPGVIAHATQLPREFRLMQLESFDDATQVMKVRLVVLDLTGANAHTDIASWEVPTRVVSASWSASTDGRRIAVIAAGTTGLIGALYLIDVPSGTVRKLYEDPQVRPATPVLSPDGRSLAHIRRPRENTASYDVQLGLWAGDSDRPDTWKRIVEQKRPQGAEAASTIVPIAWSSAARWFAYARTFVSSELFVVAREGGDEIRIGEGWHGRWHPTEARLVLFGAGYSNAPTLRVFDLGTKTSTVLATGSAGDPPRRFTNAVWDPAGERIAYAEGDPFSDSLAVSTVRADGSARTKIADASPLLQWSADGSALYAWAWSTRSAQEFRVTDLITGRVVARGCANGSLAADPCP